MVNTALQETLKKHGNLSSILEEHPSQAAALSQTLADLTYASHWQHLRVINIDSFKVIDSATWPDHCGRGLIIGLRPEARGLEAVWPCSMSDMLNTSIFLGIFSALDQLQIKIQEGDKEIHLLRTHFLLAVYSTDATVVYYNMARGLLKPVN